MKTSDQFNELAKALSIAQSEMKPAIKDSINPAYKSRYSNISSVWEAIRGPITQNGLTILQDAVTGDKCVSVTTRIIHSSGQWIEFGPFTINLVKFDAHAMGSATSYARRYALCAAVGVVSDDDDDGNAAVAAAPKLPHSVPTQKINAMQIDELQALIGKLSKERQEKFWDHVHNSYNVSALDGLKETEFYVIRHILETRIQQEAASAKED